MKTLFTSLAACLLVMSFAGVSFAFELPDNYTGDVTGLEFYPSGAKFIFTVKPNEDNTFEAILPGAFRADSVRLINPEAVKGNIKVENRSRTRWIPEGLQELNNQAEVQAKIIDELTAKKTALEQTLEFLNRSNPEKSKPEELLKFIREAQELRLSTENELADIKIQINREKEKLTMLRNELTSRRPRGETNYLVVSGKAAKPVTFEAFTASAAWRPGYIMNLDSTTGNIDVKMYIRASQKTGLDYDGRMTLHTKTPDESITTPELRALTVGIKPKEREIASVGNASYSRNNMMYRSARKEAGMAADRAMPMMMAELDEDTMIEEEPEAIEEITTVSETLSDRSLNINGLITGDGRESEFEVIRKEALILKSSPDIVLIPEQRNNAWIIANMADDNEHLIPGDCELRVDNNASGKIYLREYGEGQRKIPFGYIEQITIKKESLVGKTGVSWFSGVQTSGYKLAITNGTNESRLITVRDRLPIPTDEKIKLEVKRIEPAQKEKDAENRYSWEVEVPAGGTVNIIVDYTLSYPSGEELRYGTK
ncbi:MAG: DUF4139 domain-containing protein [Synergistaceae bacterium]|nr:DUF4139 domain-containing protein [Synergistaceae bacterium]